MVTLNKKIFEAGTRISEFTNADGSHLYAKVYYDWPQQINESDLPCAIIESDDGCAKITSVVSMTDIAQSEWQLLTIQDNARAAFDRHGRFDYWRWNQEIYRTHVLWPG